MSLRQPSPSREAIFAGHAHIFDGSGPGWWFGLLPPSSGQFWEAAEMVARIIGDHIREGDALAAGLAPPSAG